MKEECEAVRPFIQRALAGDEVSFETSVQRQGQEETLLATYVPERNAGGAIAGWYILVTNLTDHKRTERALQDSEGRFRHLFEQASDGIVTADMLGRYLDVNNRGCQMLGYSRAELLDMRVTDLLPPQDFPRLKDIQAEMLEGHRHSGEWTLRRKDGGFITVEVSAKLQPDQRWHAIARDITDRKPAEAGLRESEAQFRMLADATPVLVCIAGVDQFSTWLNKSWLDYTGRRLEDELGDGWSSGIHPDDAGRCLRTSAEHFDRREPFEAMGGQFDLTTQPGLGTSITLSAPIDRPPLAVAPLEPEAVIDADAAPISASQRLRILLVDDHAMVRQGLRSVLESYHALEVVGEGGDGEAAMELADQLQPDVVVMDINMPKIDGIEATRHIISRHPDTVIIGLSVQNERHIEEMMVKAGAAVFVTKERAAVQLHEAIISSVRTRD